MLLQETIGATHTFLPPQSYAQTYCNLFTLNLDHDTDPQFAGAAIDAASGELGQWRGAS